MLYVLPVPSLLIWSPDTIWWKVQIVKFLIAYFFVLMLLLRPRPLLRTLSSHAHCLRPNSLIAFSPHLLICFTPHRLALKHCNCRPRCFVLDEFSFIDFTMYYTHDLSNAFVQNGFKCEFSITSAPYVVLPHGCFISTLCWYSKYWRKRCEWNSLTVATYSKHRKTTCRGITNDL
jgi:hypothetical protein